MKFDKQPKHLKNNLIELIPLESNHFEMLFEVASDPLVWEQHPNQNRYKRAIFKTFFEGAMQSDGAFLIIDVGTKEVIGSSRFYDFDEKDNAVLIGYTFIARKYWGKGFNKSLKNLMLVYAFKFVDRVYFHIGSQNMRSQMAIEKIGAQKTDEKLIEYFGETPKLNYIYLINKK
ncbi:MAG: GNAT family N-acetyltransferase [Flavobacterium sp.]|nr:GNAT family N-acetyltransferase [Flavobacterium sp.]